MSDTRLAAASLREVLGLAARDGILYLIGLTFVALSLAWNFVTPIFEAPDEPAHVQYILFVATEGRRPNLWTEVSSAGTAAFESPLYYLGLGSALGASGMSHPFIYPTRNPDFTFQPYVLPPSYFLPVHGPYDYVHFLRGFSTFFGIITVCSTYVAAILLGVRRSTALVATAVTAFLPQFTFISGVVNNDTLAVALAASAFVLLLGQARTQSPNTRALLVCGGLTALAVLTKPHTIYLLPFGAIYFAMASPTTLRRFVMIVFWFVTGFLSIGSWYFVYNCIAYGDPLALRMQALIVPEQVNPKSIFNPDDALYLGLGLPRLLFQSFLGVFGWMKLYLPPLFYTGFAAFWLMIAVAVISKMLKGQWCRRYELLMVAPWLVLGIVGYANLTFDSNQGRYLFPAINAISLLFALGASELPGFLRRLVLFAMPAFLLLTNLYALWMVKTAFAMP